MTDMNKTTNQQWGGRFSEPTDAFVARSLKTVSYSFPILLGSDLVLVRSRIGTTPPPLVTTVTLLL